MDLRGVFASNLRLHRHKAGLSQEELADAAGINRTYLSKLETGRTYVGLEIIEKLAKALGVEGHEFLVKPLRKVKASPKR